MGQERQRDQWAHTSLVLSVLANIHRDPKKSHRFSPDDFNPFSNRKPPGPKAGVSILKQIFIDNRKDEVA